MPGSMLSHQDQIAFVRRLLHFGVIPESLPVAAQETLGLDEEAALSLVSQALTEDDLEVIFPNQNP